MANYKIYLESGLIHVELDVAAIEGLVQNSSRPIAGLQYPSNDALTSSVVNTDEIKITGPNDIVILSSIPHGNIRKKDGTTTYGASASAVNTALNSLFASSTLESQISTEKTRISTLEAATKTASGDRGIFLSDAKSLTSSFMRLQSTEAKFQAGGSGNTSITSTETSPGIHKFFVQAGASGSEASVEAMRITGSNTSNTKASIELSSGTALVANSSLTVNANTTLKNLSFSSTGSPHSVSFTNASVTGLAASSIGSGTFANARISSASVLQHADNYSSWNLKTGGVQRTTVSSGGDLNLVGGTDISLAYSAGGTVTINSTASGSGIADVVDDTSPQLGGHLDVNGQEIRSLSNNNITLRPNGTGTVVTTAELTLDYNNPQIKFKGDDNIHYRISVDETNNEIVFGHTTYEGIRMDSYGALTFPNINGSPSGGVTAGYLKVDGSGNVSTDTPTDTNTNIGNTDFTLSQARKLIVGGYDFSINDTSSSPLFLWDDSKDIFEFRKPVVFTDNSGYTTGEVRMMEAPIATGAEYVGFKAPSNITANCLWTLPATDGSNGQVLTTNGSKTLSWTTASGGGSSTLTQVFTQSFLDDIATTTHYLPWKDINEQTTVYQEEAAFVMPYDGKIKQVTIRVATQVDNAGNFTVGVYSCPIGTSIFSQANWTLEESEVLAFNGGSQADDHHAFHFVFDDAKHFDAGDAVSIGLRASVDPGTNSYWYVTTVIEWDTTNGLGSSSTELTTNP